MEKLIEDHLLYSEGLLNALDIAKVCDDPEVEHLMSTYKSRLSKCAMLLDKKKSMMLEKKKLLEDISVIRSECDDMAEQIQQVHQDVIDQHPDLSIQSKDSDCQVNGSECDDMAEQIQQIHQNVIDKQPNILIQSTYSDYQVPEKENISTLNNTFEVSPCPSEWDKNPLFTPLPSKERFMNKSLYYSIDDVVKPFITLMDGEEMSSVPAYMKGRLTCASVNSFIETLNSVLKKKYSIVKLKRKDVKRKDLTQYSKWKSQEEEYRLHGKTYFTAEDLVTLENTKIDKMADKIIQVLRHIKRLRQSQVSGKLVLYIVLQPEL